MNAANASTSLSTARGFPETGALVVSFGVDLSEQASSRSVWNNSFEMPISTL
jgi:hypothetical protein